MSTDLVVQTEVTERIGRLTLNRPEKLNALNKALLRAIPAASQ